MRCNGIEMLSAKTQTYAQCKGLGVLESFSCSRMERCFLLVFLCAVNVLLFKTEGKKSVFKNKEIRVDKVTDPAKSYTRMAALSDEGKKAGVMVMAMTGSTPRYTS